MMMQNHPYHLVEKSPWPLLISLNLLFLTLSLIKWFHKFKLDLTLISLFAISLTTYQWWRDVNRESSLQGLHTKKVIAGLRLGMLLFIISEVMFFFSFFWAFFHSSLSPTIEIGLSWPPMSINPFNPFKVPLLNTIILLSSGVTVTWAHHSLTENNHSATVESLTITIMLGLYFTLLQMMEYNEASFSMSDSVYGSTFFVTTGFHGLHVIIGSMFLLTSLLRILSGLISSRHHVGFEMAIWYWHFVDIVWMFLYLFIYWWSY